MYSRVLSATAVVLAASQLASAQTFTSCNPMNTTCPDDPALGSTITVDFTKGANSFFTAAAGTNITYDGTKGAVFTINKGTDAPTIISNKYIFFGKVEVVAQAAPGTGVVTSVVLESDDLDEIDWEWLGGDTIEVQTDYFGKGDTTSYDRGGFSAVSTPQTTFHTYTIDWTSAYVKWYIDGTLVRTLNYADAKSGTRFPQTPMQIKLGTWDAGADGSPEGTVTWAGGHTNFADAPFIAYYKSVTVTDYSNGVSGATSYHWSDKSGSFDSIKVLTGGSSDSSSSSSPSSTTAASSKTTSSSAATSTASTMSTVTSSATGAATTTTKATTGTTATGSTTSASASSSSTSAPNSNAAFKQGLEFSSLVVMAAGLIAGFFVL